MIPKEVNSSKEKKPLKRLVKRKGNSNVESDNKRHKIGISKYSKFPVDRLSELLLNLSETTNKMSKFLKIPVRFSDIEHYISIWEPLLVEEMKASIVSNLTSNNLQNNSSGRINLSAYVSNTDILPHENNISHILKFQYGIPAASSREMTDRFEGFSPMDMILISTTSNKLSPLEIKLFFQSIQDDKLKVFKKTNILGFVTSAYTKEGNKKNIINVNKTDWEHLQCQLVISKKNEDATLFIKSKLTSNLTNKSPSNINSNIINLAQTKNSNIATQSSSNKMKVSQSLHQSLIPKNKSNPNVPSASSNSSSTSKTSSRRPVTALPHNATTITASNSNNNINDVSSFQYYYTFIDNLTSYSREFIALHKINDIPIASEILQLNFNMEELQVQPPTPEPVSTPPLWLKSHADVPLGELSSISKLIQNSIFSASTNIIIAEPPQNSDSSSSLSTQIIPIDNTTASASLNQATSRLPEGLINTLPSVDGLTPTFLTQLLSPFNESQSQAIILSLNQKHPFSLIQGPPGTGKTSTIIGLLNAFHMKSTNNYNKVLLNAILNGFDVSSIRRSVDTWLEILQNLQKRKSRILVTAPSNIAVDNIIQRLLEKGFIDNQNNKYYPTMLRIGSSYSSGSSTGSTGNTTRSLAAAVSLEEVTDSLYAVKEEKRTAMKKELQELMVQLANQANNLLKLLLSMRAAWEAHPLRNAYGWELRISSTAQPYWVDHLLQTTSLKPPAARGAPAAAAAGGGGVPPDSSSPTLTTQPEYQIHSTALLSILHRLSVTHHSLCRLNLASSYSSRSLLESTIVEEADIVFTTLNSSGHSSLDSHLFPVVIVDEAAQATEPSALIPLRYGCEHCVLVGDPEQLPATIFSSTVKEYGFQTSLFERLKSSYASDDHSHSHSHSHTNTIPDGRNSSSSVAQRRWVMLDEQYRMLPVIAAFPSATFYSGLLRNGGNVTADGYCPPYFQRNPSLPAASALPATATSSYSDSSQSNNNMTMKTTQQRNDVMESPPPLLPSFLFFDLLSSRDTVGAEGGSQSQSQYSRYNIEESNFCLNFVRFLRREATRFNALDIGTIGIITPYAEQQKVLKTTFQQAGMLSTNTSRDKNATSSNSNNVNIGSSCIDSLTSSSSSALPSPLVAIEINTVDAFQGREMDIIIISCVRATAGESIGFLSDKRRLNVAITRARFGLYIVGRAESLSIDRNWNKLINHAASEDNNAYLVVEGSNVDLEYLLNCHHSYNNAGNIVNNSKHIISRKVSPWPACNSNFPTTTTVLVDQRNNSINVRSVGNNIVILQQPAIIPKSKLMMIEHKVLSEEDIIAAAVVQKGHDGVVEQQEEEGGGEEEEGEIIEDD